jgi:hypothetical protein
MKKLSMLVSDIEGRAATRAVISYNKLAREFGQPRITPENWHSHPFFDPFGAMDDEDIAKCWPLRTAIVYSEVLNRPGQGFFKTLAKSRGYAIAESQEADEWMVELSKLQEKYKSS